MKSRHLGLLDPISADFWRAGYEVEEEEEMEGSEDDNDPGDLFGVQLAKPVGKPATSSESVGNDLEFDRRALLATGDPRGDIGTCCFAVMEVCGGCGGISKYTIEFGLRTGPVLELKKGWDIFEGGLFMWLFRMCLAGRIWLLVFEPPCTTFSIARCPKLRTIAAAEGMDPVEFETIQGNLF